MLEHRGDPKLLNNSVGKFITWRKGCDFSPIKTSNTYGLVYQDPNSTPVDEFRFDICGSV